MPELSKQALERIEAACQIKKVSPMLAYPGAVIRFTLIAASPLDGHEILVEFTDLSTKKSEHVHAKAVTLPQQLRATVEGSRLVAAYRDGTGAWTRFFERTIPVADNVSHPQVDLDWR